MSTPGGEPRIPPVPHPRRASAPLQRNSRPACRGTQPASTCIAQKKGAERPPTFGPCAPPACTWPAPVPIRPALGRLPRRVQVDIAGSVPSAARASFRPANDAQVKCAPPDRATDVHHDRFPSTIRRDRHRRRPRRHRSRAGRRARGRAHAAAHAQRRDRRRDELQSRPSAASARATWSRKSTRSAAPWRAPPTPPASSGARSTPRKGPAVRATRCQADRALYRAAIRRVGRERSRT